MFDIFPCFLLKIFWNVLSWIIIEPSIVRDMIISEICSVTLVLVICNWIYYLKKYWRAQWCFGTLRSNTVLRCIIILVRISYCLWISQVKLNQTCCIIVCGELCINISYMTRLNRVSNMINIFDSFPNFFSHKCFTNILS